MKSILPVDMTDDERAGIVAFYRPYYAVHSGDKSRPFDGILPMMDRLRADDSSLQPVEIFAPHPYRTEHDAMHLLHRVGNAYEPLAILSLPLFRRLRKE